MIKVQHLTKHFGDFKALDSITFEVKAGEIMGFLGPNGAGKTTTMKILAGFMPPTSGKAIVNDHNVEEQNLEMRKQIGYLPESNPLYLDFTVEEALQYVAAMHGLNKFNTREAIARAVEQCSLESVFYKQIENLSKGFRQRVGLAQALLCDPKTLILDEPTVGLDPKQIIEIRELIQKLGKNRTVLLSTHIMQEVQAICDTVTIIHQGKVVASGTPDELKAKSEESMLGNIYIKLAAGTIKDTEAKLREIEGVKHVVKKDSEKKGVYGFTIDVENGVDVREAIFDAVVKNGWKLYEMTPQQISLEEVFLDVTK